MADTVTTIGTGCGPVNAGLGALAKGPVAVHRELNDQPRVLTLLLDGEAWTTHTDRRTGVRAVAAIAVLADGFDVRLVASPTVRRHLAERYPEWTEIHPGLTERRDRSLQGRRSTQCTPTETTVDTPWEIRDLDSEPGKRRLLSNLKRADGRAYRDLAHDDAIDIAHSTVSRYVLDLEARGPATVDSRGQHNTVRLTDLGHLAVQECLDGDSALVHPNQPRLDGGLTVPLTNSQVQCRPTGGDQK